MPSPSHSLQMPTKLPPRGGEGKREQRMSCVVFSQTLEIILPLNYTNYFLNFLQREDKPLSHHLFNFVEFKAITLLLTLFTNNVKYIHHFSKLPLKARNQSP